MRASIIKIGNSKGLRLSKQIIDQYQIEDQVELTLEKGRIILEPLKKSREGWSEAFQKMSENGDDQLIMEDVFEDEGFEEWS